MKKPIDLYVDNLKRLAGVNSDTELAKILHLSKQAIAAWRRREFVPLIQQQLLTALYGPEAAFDDSIGYAATRRERIAIVSAFLRLFDRYREILDPATEAHAYEEWAEMLLGYEAEMQELVRETGWIGRDEVSGIGLFTTKEIGRALADHIGERQETLGLFRDLLRPDEL